MVNRANVFQMERNFYEKYLALQALRQAKEHLNWNFVQKVIAIQSWLKIAGKPGKIENCQMNSAFIR